MPLYLKIQKKLEFSLEIYAFSKNIKKSLVILLKFEGFCKLKIMCCSHIHTRTRARNKIRINSITERFPLQYIFN